MSISNGITDHGCGLAESTCQPYRVLIADEHPIVRVGLAALINCRSDMIVIAEASSGREAVDQFVAQSPDLALLELNLPLMDGIETVKSILCREPRGASGGVHNLRGRGRHLPGAKGRRVRISVEKYISL